MSSVPFVFASLWVFVNVAVFSFLISLRGIAKEIDFRMIPGMNENNMFHAMHNVVLALSKINSLAGTQHFDSVQSTYQSCDFITGENIHVQIS